MGLLAGEAGLVMEALGAETGRSGHLRAGDAGRATPGLGDAGLSTLCTEGGDFCAVVDTLRKLPSKRNAGCTL